MEALRVVMTVQAITLLAFGLPSLLVPALAIELAGQLPLPEPCLLRAAGVAFVMLAWIEFLVAGDLVRHWPLVLAYATLPAVTCATIVLHYLTRGFKGEAWFWWMNAAVSAALALALFATRHAAAEASEDDIPAETG
jgi:hypothetical protein